MATEPRERAGESAPQTRSRACEAAMGRLAAAVGAPLGFHARDPDTGEYRFQPGGWRLDYRGRHQGGVTIERLTDEAGGVDHPLGPARLPARHFVTACDMAVRAVELSKRPETREKERDAR